jgi:hypothetical protein
MHLRHFFADTCDYAFCLDTEDISIVITYSTTCPVISCTTCPAGFHCPADTSVTNLGSKGCGVGQYSGAGAFECLDCPAGYSCSDPAQPPTACSAGYYAPSTKSTGCALCPAGRRCPVCEEGSIDCASGTSIICPANTYSPAGEASCLPVPTGFASQAGAAEAVALTNNCVAGEVIFSGDQKCTPCTMGSYPNSAGDKCLQCPAGHECLDPRTAPVPCTVLFPL